METLSDNLCYIIKTPANAESDIIFIQPQATLHIKVDLQVKSVSILAKTLICDYPIIATHFLRFEAEKIETSEYAEWRAPRVFFKNAARFSPEERSSFVLMPSNLFQLAVMPTPPLLVRNEFRPVAEVPDNQVPIQPIFPLLGDKPTSLPIFSLSIPIPKDVIPPEADDFNPEKNYEDELEKISSESNSSSIPAIPSPVGSPYLSARTTTYQTHHFSMKRLTFKDETAKFPIQNLKDRPFDSFSSQPLSQMEKRLLQEVNKKRKKRFYAIQAEPGKGCLACNTAQSTIWKEGPQGMHCLCNSCGIIYTNLKKTNLKKRKVIIDLTGSA